MRLFRKIKTGAARRARRKRQGAAALALLFGLASCTVGPNYVKPAAPMQETFKEMEGWKKAEPKEDLLRGNWWEVFANPELSALEEQVSITNQNIATAEANFRQALALVQVARASYFPTVGVAPSATRLYRSTGSAVSASTAGSTTAPTVNIYSAPGSASWAPDLWGLVRRNVESSRASAQASAATLEGVRLSAHGAGRPGLFPATHPRRPKSTPPRDGRGLPQVPATDREQIQGRGRVEGRRAPGGDAAQDDPRPGDRRGRAARPDRARHCPPYGQAAGWLLTPVLAALGAAALHTRGRALRCSSKAGRTSRPPSGTWPRPTPR